MLRNPIKQEALIALGANLPSRLGPPERTLSAALGKLSDRGVKTVKLSRFFRTPCFPAGAGPDYVNAAAKLEVDIDAQAILAVLHEVEAEFGRERIQRWGQRTLDLDLIAIGDHVWPDQDTFHEWHSLPSEEQTKRAPDQLILPHPRLQDRAFVLVPLADVDPMWRHPILGQSVVEMRDALDPKDLSDVVPI